MAKVSGASTLESADPPLRPATSDAGARCARPVLVLAYLFTVYATTALGMGLVPALVTTFRGDYGLSGSQVAAVQNLKDLGLIGMMFAGPVILRRLGVSRATVLAIVVGLAGCGTFMMATTYVGVLVGSFLHGAAFSLGSLATVNYLYRLPAQYRRISALCATFGIASFVAPSLVGLLVPASGNYQVVYAVFAAGLGVLLVMGVVLDLTTTQSTGVTSTGNPRLSLTMLWQLLPDISVYATLMAGETIVVSWVTSLGQYRYGMSLADASLLLAVLWMVYTPARAAGDLLAKRFSVPCIVLAGSLLIIAGNVFLCAGSVFLAYVGVIVFALGTAPLIPVYQGWVLTRNPIDLHSPVNASLGVGSAAATTVMVFLTGLTVNVDTRIPFAMSVALTVAVACWATRSLLQHSKRNESRVEDLCVGKPLPTDRAGADQRDGIAAPAGPDRPSEQPCGR